MAKKKKVMTVIESTRKAGRASMAKLSPKQRSELGRRGAKALWAARRNPRGADGKFKVRTK